MHIPSNNNWLKVTINCEFLLKFKTPSYLVEVGIYPRLYKWNMNESLSLIEEGGELMLPTTKYMIQLFFNYYL
jgi:hypothetical protein